MSVNDIRFPSAPIVQRNVSTNSSLPAVQPKKTDRSSPADGTVQKNNTGDLLTVAEKEYFAKLFPDAAADVRSYHPYQKDGSVIVTHVGTVVDRRG